MVTIFTTWHHRWLFFTELQANMTTSDLPSIVDFQDRNWEPHDRLVIVDYLTNAPELVTSSKNKLSCIFCGEAVAGDSWVHSDGSWCWPHGLAHYVQLHSVRLPDRFVSHIRDNGYEPSGWGGDRWDLLDWPR